MRRIARFWTSACPTQLGQVLRELEPFRESLKGVAVESTFNWYWLANGLEDHGYQPRLVNTCAAKQYEGLKFRNDAHDARWIAHMMRLGILPLGSIMDRERRAVRDLLSRRMRVVQQRVQNLLQLKSMIANHTGEMIPASKLKKLEADEIPASITDPLTRRSIVSALRIQKVLKDEIADLQKTAYQFVKQEEDYKLLRTIKGVGELLAMVILYETGDVQRFASVGNYASYCRCVQSKYESNGKKKGVGNRKNGNAYLSWAFAQTAHFAIRFQPSARRFYDKKSRKTNARIAASAVSHKLARAVYFMLRDKVPYRTELLFGATG